MAQSQVMRRTYDADVICIYDGATWVQVDGAATVLAELLDRVAALEAKQEES